MDSKLIHGAPSWQLQSNSVRLSLTEMGGHMAPVEFRLGERWVQPYSLPPWTADSCEKEIDAVTRVLRGDFFCLPFGVSEGIRFPHGDSANARWTLADLEHRRINVVQQSVSPPASIEKEIHLQAEQTAVYIEHRIRGLAGDFSYGHHPILQFPDSSGPYHVSTSSFVRAEVAPYDLQDDSIGQRSVLEPGAKFESLQRIPRRDSGFANLSVYPTLEGCEEVVMLANSPGELAWNAVVLNGYVWFSLKRAEDFPCTLLWVSNGGRDFSPWNGLHIKRLGVEDVCSYFGVDRETCATQPWQESGVSTARAFARDDRVALRHIQAVSPLPKGAGAVLRVEFLPGGERIRLHVEKVKPMEVNVHWDFLTAIE